MLSSPMVECRSSGMSVSPVSVGSCLIVVVAGEADWITAPELREQLTAARAYGPQSMVLDLTDLEFCNVAGLRALLEVVEAARQVGVQVALRGMSRQLACLHRMFVAHRRAGHRGGLPAGRSGRRSPPEDVGACPSVACACESAP